VNLETGGSSTIAVRVHRFATSGGDARPPRTVVSGHVVEGAGVPGLVDSAVLTVYEGRAGAALEEGSIVPANSADTIAIPATLVPHLQAVLATVAGLSIVDALTVELGDRCVVSGTTGLARLTALVAGWAGAWPIMLTPGSAPPPPAGVEHVLVDDLEAALATLSARLQESPSVVAIELTGLAAMVDLLLQSAPMFARLLFAGDARQPLTIDFYTNVHRKGLLLQSMAIDLPDFVASPRDGEGSRRLTRALGLLSRPDRLAACQAAFATSPPSA
jgi:hypothetical protein